MVHVIFTSGGMTCYVYIHKTTTFFQGFYFDEVLRRILVSWGNVGDFILRASANTFFVRLCHPFLCNFGKRAFESQIHFRSDGLLSHNAPELWSRTANLVFQAYWNAKRHAFVSNPENRVLLHNQSKCESYEAVKNVRNGSETSKKIL